MSHTSFSLILPLQLAIALSALLGIENAAAAKEKGIRAQEMAAKKACAMGDYQKGADILTDLFLATNEVTYIYNHARCYEQNAIWDRAIVRFREYLRKATGLSETDRADVDRHIRECEAAMNHGEQATTSPPNTQQPTPAGPAAVPSEGTTASATPAVQPPATPEMQPRDVIVAPPVSAPASSVATSPGRGLRLAGVILGAVGVAAIGTGVGFALKTQSISSNEDKNGPTQAQEDDRRRYETLGWISYGLGAAALATGVVLYVVGWPSEEPGAVAIAPTLTSPGGTLLLGGRF